MPSFGTLGARMKRSRRAGFRSDPAPRAASDGSEMTEIIAASESARSGDAKCNMLSTDAAQTKVAAVEASAIQTRCRSSNARVARAVHDSCASARMRLITPGWRPVQSSAGPGAAARRSAWPTS